MVRRDGVQHTAGETRARQQAELPARTSESQTGKRLWGSLQEQVSPWGLQEGSFLHSCWGPGAGLQGLHHAGEAGNGRGHLSHSQCLAWFSFTQKLLRQLPGNPQSNHCAGRLLYQNRRRRGSDQGQGSSLRPGLVPGPHPVLCQRGHVGALTKQNPVPLRPRPSQTRREQGKSTQPAPPPETGETGGPEPWALVPAPGLSCPRPTVRG